MAQSTYILKMREFTILESLIHVFMVANLFVFEIIGEEKMEDFRYVSDYDIIDKVFDAYNKLSRKNNES